MQVLVRDNNVDQALKALKKKMQREGIFREMKLRNYYEKPSEKRVREQAEAVRRARKLARKRAQREGCFPVRLRSNPGRSPAEPVGAPVPAAPAAGRVLAAVLAGRAEGRCDPRRTRRRAAARARPQAAPLAAAREGSATRVLRF